MIRRSVWLLTNVLLCGAYSVCAQQNTKATLRDAYAEDFLVGIALNQAIIDRPDSKKAQFAAEQFSSLTAENEMKWSFLHKQEGRYDFRGADAFVAYAEKNKMAVIGHTLVWHSQTPEWVFKDAVGAPASRELLLQRMRDHIFTVAGRYKGRIKGWDVVNEAIADGPEGLRESPWRNIIGDDYIDHAFRYAREADPKAELYYNDYGMENKHKRARTVEMLKELIARGVPIDGVGTQGHYHLNTPSLDDVEQTIKDFSALGLKVMVTELDVDVLPWRGQQEVADISRTEKADPQLNPYVAGLPEEISVKQAKRYADLFEIFLRHRDVVTRVTIWGLDDGSTWLNQFPIRGRTNHPVLLDRQINPKPAYFSVLRTGQEFKR